MDILNFISWIKSRRQVTSVTPDRTLIPLGLKDGRRDDQYLSGAITAQDFINQVVSCVPVPPAGIIVTSIGANSTIRCGLNNLAYGEASTVLGQCSTAFGDHSVISGGCSNLAINKFSFIGGGENNKICTGSSSYGYNTITSGINNTISGYTRYATISGGYCNRVSSEHSTIGGGVSNCTGSGSNAVIAGGQNNRTQAQHSGVLGGVNNLSNCSCSFIVGSNITTNRTCATFVNNLSIMDIPTSASGLPSGAVWRSGTALQIVP